MSKRCKKCNGKGPFGFDRKKPDGLDIYCRFCKAKFGKKYRRENVVKERRRHRKYRRTVAGKATQKRGTMKWRSKNRDRVNAAHRSWRKRNIKYCRRAEQKWRDEHREQMNDQYREHYRKNPEHARDKSLRFHYGMTTIEWEAIFSAQGRCCAICKCKKSGKRRWSTDHNHHTAEIRGILCGRCNRLLGALGDNTVAILAFAKKLIAYLARPPVHPGRRRHWYSRKQLKAKRNAGMKNERVLVELIRVLSQGTMMTALQIANQMRCSKPVAYDRLRALKKRGVVFQTVIVREGSTGPRSIAYAIAQKET